MLGVTSLVTMIHAAKLCDDNGYCKNEMGWAVACSSVSFAICLVYLVVWFFLKRKQDFIPAGRPMQIFSAVMTLWWTAGAGVMTFDAPFKTPSNGYFGTWMSFFICAVTSYTLFPQLSEATGHLAQAGNDQLFVLVAALVFLIQASSDCGATECKEEYTWGVICSVFVFIIAGVLIFLRKQLPAIAFKIVSIAQLLFWGFGWAVLTYRTPYVAVGNGYFSLLIGFIFSCKLAVTAFGGVDEIAGAIEGAIEEFSPKADAEKPEGDAGKPEGDAEQPKEEQATTPF